MARYKTEEVVTKMREVDVYIAQGKPIAEACKLVGVSKNTYATWKKVSTVLVATTAFSASGISPRFGQCP